MEHTAHAPSLLVKVAQDDTNALVLFAEEVLYRDLDVVECNISRARSWGVRSLDGLGFNALAALDEDYAKPLTCADAGDKVIAPSTVCNPLLGAVDDL